LKIGPLANRRVSMNNTSSHSNFTAINSVNQTCPRVHDVASVNFSISSQVRGARRQLAAFLRPTAYSTNYLLVFIQLPQPIGLLKGTAQSISIHTILPLAY